MKHAPGPWESKYLAANASSGHVILWQDRSKPGVHMRRLDSKGEFAGPDARLIAAAPELLEALESAQMAIMGYTHQNAITLAALEKARAAIAKARTK